MQICCISRSSGREDGVKFSRSKLGCLMFNTGIIEIGLYFFLERFRNYIDEKQCIFRDLNLLFANYTNRSLRAKFLYFSFNLML